MARQRRDRTDLQRQQQRHRHFRRAGRPDHRRGGWPGQNGFITAYAHNRALLVKTGQNVKRGANIAVLGQSDTTSPRLHFEIRRQGTPVDPMQYLPAK
ncbi:hypothetical protein G6F46_015240 [Rhizopus delemar]|nr:hypothetical protein G6F46_015240 [Rhizopus delemar]